MLEHFRRSAVGLLLGVAVAVSSVAKGDSPDYLKIVRDYADAMIEHGRDRYGPVESPLFAAALDRKMLKLLEGEALDRALNIPRSQWGVRPNDRTPSGANPMHDENLYQVLYALTEVTGEEAYAAEADRALRWFFEHCQSPATGLMAWGEHLGWDFREEKPTGDIHEFARPWVLWERSFELAPQPCARFASGLWQHQIADRRTGRFSRHASFARHAPAAGREFPRHGGFYIATWAAAYEHTKDAEFLAAIEVLVDSFEKRRNPETGTIPADSTNVEVLWPPSNLSLAIDLWDGAQKVPEPLGDKMRACAARTDDLFLKLSHDLGPEGQGFLGRGVTSSLAPDPNVAGHSSHTDTWSTGYGEYTDAQMAMFCLLRYQQVKREGYKRLFLAAVERYVAREPDRSAVLWPGVMGDAITLLLAAYRTTGDPKYVARAGQLADAAVEVFFPGDSPLPKASSLHDHYEAITRADTLAMALLDLWAAKHRPDVDLGMIWPER
ncbi:MAG: hypothetical protein ABIK89_16450 [Planctomycetota bacterium]